MATTSPTPHDVLSGLALEEAPVLEAIVHMHLDTLAGCRLDEGAYHLVRLAALVAADAPPASYAVHLGLARERGVTLEDMQATLVAIAPIVGSARITAAAGNILKGVGLTAAVDDGS